MPAWQIHTATQIRTLGEKCSKLLEHVTSADKRVGTFRTLVNEVQIERDIILAHLNLTENHIKAIANAHTRAAELLASTTFINSPIQATDGVELRICDLPDWCVRSTLSRARESLQARQLSGGSHDEIPYQLQSIAKAECRYTVPERSVIPPRTGNPASNKPPIDHRKPWQGTAGSDEDESNLVVDERPWGTRKPGNQMPLRDHSPMDQPKAETRRNGKAQWHEYAQNSRIPNVRESSEDSEKRTLIGANRLE